MSKQFQCELVSWSEVYRLSFLLAEQVRQAGYQPDIVIAIARGGYVPARLVCDFLDIYNLTGVRISHYTAGSSKEETARLSSPLCMGISDLKVLVIDDITDTGDTLDVALHHINTFKPAEIKVGVLQHKQQSFLKPDFFAKSLRKWRWIIYPWAVVEDIGGFLRAMPRLPATVNEARDILKSDHGLTVPTQTLTLILNILESQRS